MLKIDLLPAGVREARRAKKWLFLPVVTVLAAVIVVFLLIGRAASERNAAQAEFDKWDAERTRVQQIENEMNAILAEIQPYVTLAQFCKQFEQKNPVWADVVEAVARYVMADVQISSINVTNSTVAISGQVPDLETLTRFVMNFQRCRMPAEGGGTEPLWSDDAVSRGVLVPVFARVDVNADVGGGFATSGTTSIYSGQAGAGAAAPGAGAAEAYAEEEYAGEEEEEGALPTGVGVAGAGGGQTRYVNGVLVVPPISFTIVGHLTPGLTQKLTYMGLAAGGGAPSAAPAGVAAGAEEEEYFEEEEEYEEEEE